MAIKLIKVYKKKKLISQIQSAMSAFKFIILYILILSGTKAQDFVGICNQMKNPLGTCDCPGNTNQLWISADCTEVNIYCSAKITFYYKTFTSLCFQKKAALEV